MCENGTSCNILISMTPAEGSDLEIGLSDPSAGVVKVVYTYLFYTQVFGTACLDLCLFSTDLCRGPYS